MMKDHTLSVIRPDVILSCLRAARPAIPRNPTHLPDAFAETLTPVILIRHPALSIPSFYRLQRDVMKHDVRDQGFNALVTQRWVRLVFDYYLHVWAARQPTRATQNCARPSVELADTFPASTLPIVLDAEELSYDPGPLLAALCTRLGLDQRGLQLTWDPVPDAERPSDGLMQAFFQDMWKSSGWQQPKRVGQRCPT